MRSRKVSFCLLYGKGQKSIILTGAKITINAQSRFAEKMTLKNMCAHAPQQIIKSVSNGRMLSDQLTRNKLDLERQGWYLYYHAYAAEGLWRS